MARGKRLSDESRAAVIAGLTAGKTSAEVSAETGVPIGTVSRMRSQLPQELMKVEETRQVRIGDMIAQHLATQLETLDAYARETSRPGFISAQSGGDIAALHGAVSNHAWRLIDLASRLAGAGVPVGEAAGNPG